MTLTKLLNVLDTKDQMLRDHAWRELKASIEFAISGAYAGEYGSLRMVADASRSINQALAVIEPGDGDDEWVAEARLDALELAIAQMTHRKHMILMRDANTLTRACRTAETLCPVGSVEVW